MSLFFFSTDTATTEIYTLSLHDALPISLTKDLKLTFAKAEHLKRNAVKSPDLKKILSALKPVLNDLRALRIFLDRKSTRLNSSHTVISYAVFCLKKKKKKQKEPSLQECK